ncbi:MAG: pyridoxamine 5'-phosphate oxidase family protein [Deltaproteobacteria bacterium]|nr:MAG: pyridoxamine 5'-phosphate oxidase family protein [Deltaproteobacteria bacterium]
MRRKDREIRNRETIAAMLERSLVGRMATVNRKGFPVIRPVNFVFHDGKIYLHSSMKGEKVSDIRRGSPVCFEVDEPVAYRAAAGAACKASFFFRSIIIKGEASFVKPTKRKLEILERLMEKYQPEGGYGGFEEEIVKKTAVIEISIREMTGKEKLG